MNKTQKEAPTISVDDFMEELKLFADQGYQLSFSGLEYYRLKHRGDKLVQMEFNESVYLDDQGDVVVENH